MENETSGKSSSKGHEPKQKDPMERKSMAQAWQDYCALDHTPKTEFNPVRTTPMSHDRGSR